MVFASIAYFVLQPHLIPRLQVTAKLSRYDDKKAACLNAESLIVTM
jgi:hypothetical protein